MPLRPLHALVVGVVFAVAGCGQRSCDDCSESEQGQRGTGEPLEHHETSSSGAAETQAQPDSPGADSSPAPQDCADVHAAAVDILDRQCAGCHARGEDAGSFDHVLDLERMVSTEMVVPGSPDQSPVWTKIDRDLMPPSPYDPVSEADVELLRRWIARCYPHEAMHDDCLDATPEPVLPSCHGGEPHCFTTDDAGLVDISLNTGASCRPTGGASVVFDGSFDVTGEDWVGCAEGRLTAVSIADAEVRVLDEAASCAHVAVWGNVMVVVGFEGVSLVPVDPSRPACTERDAVPEVDPGRARIEAVTLQGSQLWWDVDVDRVLRGNELFKQKSLSPVLVSEASVTRGLSRADDGSFVMLTADATLRRFDEQGQALDMPAITPPEGGFEGAPSGLLCFGK